MGKKTRKTRWRTLSIGDGPSDTESQGGDFTKHPPQKWGVNKFNSSNSTPTKNRESFSKWSSRSNSNTSESKITFNEDEYTRITTPRQDVLFKKGYLSKPKQQNTSNTGRKSLTSAGNSTGDGTPDHHSADGADYEQEPEMEFYPPEIYPTPLYYINYESHTQTQQPLLLYDPYGNTTTVLYPQNYSQPQIDGPDPATNSQAEEEEPPIAASENLEKKRNSLDSDDFGTGTETEGENSPSSTSNLGDESTSAPKYRVDAEEFIPRSFHPFNNNQQFVPLEMFPVVLVHPPLPQFYPHVNQALENVENVDDANNHSSTVDIQSIVSKLEQAAQNQKIEEEYKTIDIKTETDDAAIVEIIKIEETIEKVVPAPPEVVPAPPANRAESKVVPRPLKQVQNGAQKTEKQKYSDRLKNPIRKPPTNKQNTIAPRLTSTQPNVCPRLNRSATVTNAQYNHHHSIVNNNKKSENDWVCVNSKKKRKQQRNNDEKQETVVEETVDSQQQLNIVQINEEINNIVENETKEQRNNDDEEKQKTLGEEIIDSQQQQQQHLNIVQINEEKITVENETIVENKTSDKNKVQKTKQKQQKKPKKRIIITDAALSIKVENPPPIVTPPVVVNLVTRDPIKDEPEKLDEKINVVNESTKKSKKKRNKIKNTQLTAAPPTINISENIDNNDDISSELDRMITRGLYSTLEQRLQTHNPSDTFLTTLNSTTTVSIPRPNQPAVLSPLSPTCAPVAEMEKASLPNGKITQAVREWMEKTRERTPEVEIFRKPEELRQDVLSKVLDDLEQGEDVLERSRSVSLSWDYDDCPNSPQSPPVEAAVEVHEDDVLGPYNSVYGSAGDFQRIQSEVLGLRPNNRGGPRDGGLPYRAICCSIM